jgi:hypothetical protein
VLDAEVKDLEGKHEMELQKLEDKTQEAVEEVEEVEGSIKSVSSKVCQILARVAALHELFPKPYGVANTLTCGNANTHPTNRWFTSATSSRGKSSKQPELRRYGCVCTNGGRGCALCQRGLACVCSRRCGCFGCQRGWVLPHNTKPPSKTL